MADFAASDDNDWTSRIAAVHGLAEFKTGSVGATLRRLESDKEHRVFYDAKYGQQIDEQCGLKIG